MLVLLDEELGMMKTFLIWIASLFSSQVREAVASRERELFAFSDGQSMRRVDPLVAWRKLWSHPEIDLSSELKITANPLMSGQSVYTAAEVYAAEDRVRELVRDVFGVRRWSEQQVGLTEAETDDLLASFMAYIGDLKKKRNPSPMTPPPSESREQPSFTACAPSDTSMSPDSGSTATGSTDAARSGS